MDADVTPHYDTFAAKDSFKATVEKKFNEVNNAMQLCLQRMEAFKRDFKSAETNAARAAYDALDDSFGDSTAKEPKLWLDIPFIESMATGLQEITDGWLTAFVASVRKMLFDLEIKVTNVMKQVSI